MDGVSAIGAAMESECFGFGAGDARGVLCEPGRTAFPLPQDAQMNLPAETKIDPLQLLSSVPPAPPADSAQPQYCAVSSLDLPPDAFRWKEAAQVSQNSDTLAYEDCQSNGLGGGPGLASGVYQQPVNNPLAVTPGITMTVMDPPMADTVTLQAEGATTAPQLLVEQFPEIPGMESGALQEPTQDFYGVQEIAPLGDTVVGEDQIMTDPGQTTGYAGMDAVPGSAIGDASPAPQAAPLVPPEEESELMNGVDAVTLSIERYQAARKGLRDINAGTSTPIGALPRSQGGGLGTSNLDMSVVTYAARNFRQVMEQETELLEANANAHQLAAVRLGGGDDDEPPHKSFQKSSNDLLNQLSSIYNTENLFDGSAENTNNSGGNGNNNNTDYNSAVDQLMQGVDAVDQLIQGGNGDAPGGENFSEACLGLQNDDAQQQLLSGGEFLQPPEGPDGDTPPSFTGWANDDVIPAPPIPPEDTHEMEQQFQQQDQYQHQGWEQQDLQQEQEEQREQSISPSRTPRKTRTAVAKATGLDEKFGSGMLPESSLSPKPGNSATPTQRKRDPKAQGRSSKEHIIFDREQLTDLFDMRIDAAAEILGVCTTVIKRQCRLHGIERWPARKLQAILKQISNLEKVPDMAPLVQRWRANRGPWPGITDEQQTRIVHLYQLQREKHDIAKTPLPMEWRMPAELLPEGSVGEEYVI